MKVTLALQLMGSNRSLVQKRGTDKPGQKDKLGPLIKKSQIAMWVVVVLSLLTGQAAYAQTQPTEAATIKALLAEVTQLKARLERLEAKQKPAQIREETLTATAIAPTPPAPPAQSSWTNRVKLNGDFRYRHEAFDIENRRDRHRQRMRARVAVTGQVSENVSSGFGLATGGSDPISTNQSFDDAGSSKNVVIDLAYINWKTQIDGLEIRAGKFNNPIHRAGGNGLIWDGDLNPEGVGLTFERDNVFANMLGSWIDESSGDDDSFLLGGQFGINSDLGERSGLVAGLGYYHYLDARGEPAFFDGSAMGNLLNAQGEYVNGFELAEAFVEYTTKIANGTKISLFADYVQNLDANDYNQGFALGGRVKGEQWQFGYTYQELEADAVLGTFSDSDFIGGGTDGEGHILHAGYSLSKRIALRGTLFLSDRNVDFGVEESFKRLMLDISFKY